ncbi:ABC transporter substrate-binding protein [Chthonobacter albigriseus]|uniref:ABC transporter substrate-binding protein n=1 Tax=Chthonobacter albigriseus TaxID=1683161 RepID=UPI0015EF7C81|nr:ABC transporter substrate-binding protein [Chthonobacter albigriseus]
MRGTLKHLAIGAAFVAASMSMASAAELSIMSFGGAYQEAQRKAYFETYTAKTGTKIIEQEYGGEIAKIKAQIEAGGTTLDVVDVDAPTLQQGCDEGLYEILDWSKIGPQEDWIPGTSSDCGVGTIVYATVLAYDTEKLANGPTTIADLFDTAKFPGKRGLWKNPMSNLEFALLADGVPAAEVYATLSTPEGLDRAFAKLDTIKKDAVWWEAGAQPPQLLASGEVVMTTVWNGRIANANKEGKKFAIVWDNQLLDTDYWVIPKGAKNLDLAYDFIAHTADPKVMAGISNYITYGPVRKAAAEFINPEMLDKLPTAPANMTKAMTIDYGFWGDNGEEIRKRFTTWLAQ